MRWFHHCCETLLVPAWKVVYVPTYPTAQGRRRPNTSYSLLNAFNTFPNMSEDDLPYVGTACDQCRRGAKAVECGYTFLFSNREAWNACDRCIRHMRACWITNTSTKRLMNVDICEVLTDRPPQPHLPTLPYTARYVELIGRINLRGVTRKYMEDSVAWEYREALGTWGGHDGAVAAMRTYVLTHVRQEAFESWEKEMRRTQGGTTTAVLPPAQNILGVPLYPSSGGNVAASGDPGGYASRAEAPQELGYRLPDRTGGEWVEAGEEYPKYEEEEVADDGEPSNAQGTDEGEPSNAQGTDEGEPSNAQGTDEGESSNAEGPDDGQGLTAAGGDGQAVDPRAQAYLDQYYAERRGRIPRVCDRCYKHKELTCERGGFATDGKCKECHTSGSKCTFDLYPKARELSKTRTNIRQGDEKKKKGKEPAAKKAHAEAQQKRRDKEKVTPATEPGPGGIQESVYERTVRLQREKRHKNRDESKKHEKKH